MSRILRRTLVALVILGFAGACAVRQPAVQDAVLARVAARIAGEQAAELFEDDALRVVLCGTSSPLPHPTRAKACVAVFAGGRFYVVDVGPGSWSTLANLRVDGSRIGGIFLSHFHSDHIGELGEFDMQTWVSGRPGPLRVYGPPGVERVVAGFEEAYALDTGYRIEHHGSEALPESVGRMEPIVVAPPDAGAGPTVALEEGDLTVTAFSVNHAPIRPAFGYRFDYRGRSVVVSGDTIKDPSLIAAASGADVLVHEAQANHIVETLSDALADAGRVRTSALLRDVLDYHTTPVQAAEAANEAGVKLLVLYHLVPPPPPVPLFERVFVRGLDDAAETDWVVGDDGLLIELPVGSDAVKQESLL